MKEPILLILLKKFQPKSLIGQYYFDIPINHLVFLDSKEPETNEKGVKISKSYYYKGYEVLKIEYHKIFGTHTYNNKEYENIFLGMRKSINYYDYAKNVTYKKQLPAYYFNLSPILINNNANEVIGFSSLKQRSILQTERKRADHILQSRSPSIYNNLNNYYAAEYDLYIKTGNKSKLVTALNNEKRIEVKTYLTNAIEGLSITAKDQILNNLQ